MKQGPDFSAMNDIFLWELFAPWLLYYFVVVQNYFNECQISNDCLPKTNLLKYLKSKETHGTVCN